MTMQGRVTGTLIERRYAEVQLTVAMAARDLFIENRSTAVTVREIARRAGISERTLYRHFPSKADIFIPLFERLTQRLFDSLWSSDPRESNLVTALVDAFTEEIATDSGDWQGLLEILIDTDEYRSRWDSLDRQIVDGLADWLGQHSVYPDDTFVRKGIAIVILAASRASYTEWIRRPGRPGIDALRALHFRLFDAVSAGWQSPQGTTSAS